MKYSKCYVVKADWSDGLLGLRSEKYRWCGPKARYGWQSSVLDLLSPLYPASPTRRLSHRYLAVETESQ
jgi:hypothetical protein